MSRVFVDSEKCSGCRTCEVSCSFFKTNEFNPKRGRIRVVKMDKGVDMPTICVLCAKPKCVEACPEHALSKSGELGVIRLDEEKCTGCGLCAEKCVIGAIYLDPKTSMPLICDLCSGEPRCVAWCPTGTLSYRRKESSGRETRTSTALVRAEPYLSRWGLVPVA